jgi:hypothetical protein
MSRDDNPIAAFLPASARPPIDAVIDMIDGVARTIQVARALAEAQRPIELTGLENMVGLLVARLFDLDYAEGRSLRERLIALERDLACLEARLPTR